MLLREQVSLNLIWNDRDDSFLNSPANVNSISLALHTPGFKRFIIGSYMA